MANPAAGTITFRGPNLTAVLQGPDGPVAKDLSRRASRVRSEAVRRCPVDTGRLRSSIRWILVRDSQGLAAIVGTDVHYAVYVHNGTRGRPGRPFLTEALAAAL